MAVKAYAQFQIAPFAMTALNKAYKLGLTTAIIAPLTKAGDVSGGLIAAVKALTVKGDQVAEQRRIAETLRVCVAGLIFTDTNVAAADTQAGLRTVVTGFNAGVPLYHSGPHLEA